MIFDGVKYYLPSTLPDDRQQHLTNLLTQNNATRADSAYDATHIITNSDAFEGWRDVGPKVAIVRDIWVERSIAAGKMQHPSFYSPSRSKIFSGVVACSADLRLSDEEILTAGITSLGGQWRMGLTKDVTHLFAMSTTSEKYLTGMSYNKHHLKVLVPNWFDDSVLLGIPDLSTEAYEWPDPAVLKRRPISPTHLQHARKLQRTSLSPQKKALYKTATWEPTEPKLNSKNVWGGRRILLSTTLELTGPRRKIVEDGIRQAYGVPVAYTLNNRDGSSEEELHLVDNCDVFITRYRTGPAFFKAWRKGKEIGTLCWLLNVQVTGVHSSPLDQILHFPIPHGAVEGFNQQSISVTNYTGESRDYLKKLITLMGGNFTASLSRSSTVLVAAQKNGPKTAKATEWSIPVVNHTWLEDCFLRWHNLTPAVDKYIAYPAGIDFANLLGERGVGSNIQEIIAEEAEREGEEVVEEDEDGDAHGPRTSPSQNSADETEVEGGLVPPVDMDVDMNMDGGEGQDNEVDFDMEDRKSDSPPMSFEDDAHPPRPAVAGPSTPTTPKSASASAAKPKTPKSARSSPAKPTSARKGRIRGLSTSSESHWDDEIIQKVVHVARPTSAKKASVKKVGVVSRPRPVPKKRGRNVESEAEASEEGDSPVKKPAVVPLTPPLAKKKGRDTESEAEVSQDDEPAPRPPRKQLVRRVTGPAALRAPDSVLRDLDSDSDDLDDLPEQLILPSESPKAKPPVAGGTIRAARIPPEPPKGKMKAPPRKATPTPPSSPLSEAPSPKVLRRVPTTTVEVVVPDVKTLSASAKKPAPTRTQSISVISGHQRAAPVSAPARSRLATTSTDRGSSPPPSSSVAAPKNLGRVKRSAATKASQRLHDQVMPDVLKHEQEMRNWGRKGRRVSGLPEPDEEEDEVEQPSSKRRKLEVGKKGRASTSGDESMVEHRAKAKPRKSEALRNGKPIKLMTTGVDLTDDVLKALAKLGAKVTSRSTECTHLVVATLLRTEKFLCALPGAPFILTKDWAMESAAEDSIMPETNYLLEDPAAEAKYRFSLADALDRAREHKGHLFKDHVFYITPNVPTPPALLRNVVAANGGLIKTNQQPSLRMLDTHPNWHVVSCKEDKGICAQFAAVHPIYTNELILMSALRQEIDWEDLEEFKLP